MSFLDGILDKPKALFASNLEKLKALVFGVNNERLDFLLDSFYKLDNRERVAILSIGVSAVSIIVLMVVGFYFYQVSALKSELNDSFAALHELDRLKTDYSLEQQKFSDVSDRLLRKTSDLRVKPYIEKLGRELGVPIEIADEKREAISSENPLSEKAEILNAELRISKVSVPRLLKLISEIEKSDYLLTVRLLEVKALFGQKLFFSSKVILRGYVSRNS